MLSNLGSISKILVESQNNISTSNLLKVAQDYAVETGEVVYDDSQVNTTNKLHGIYYINIMCSRHLLLIISTHFLSDSHSGSQ